MKSALRFSPSHVLALLAVFAGFLPAARAQFEGSFGSVYASMPYYPGGTGSAGTTTVVASTPTTTVTTTSPTSVVAPGVTPSVTVVQTAAVDVDATTVIRTVDPRCFGLNAVMWDDHASTPQSISLLQAAGVHALRVPGGSLSDAYHWAVNRAETDTTSGSTTTRVLNNQTWATGFDGFSQLISSLNCQAQTFVTVNYGTGTPEEAAAWVAYANAPSTLLGTGSDVTLGTDADQANWQTAGTWSAMRAAAHLATDDGHNFLRVGRTAPLGIKYWEIGNECYGATWEADVQGLVANRPGVAHDPYTYAVRVRDYIAKMKAVDPTIKIGVVAVTGVDSDANNTNHPVADPHQPGHYHNGWTPVMLATLRSLGVTPDFLIYHRYEQAPYYESDATLLQAAKTWAADAADLRQQLTDYLGAAGAGVELVVTENNSVYQDPGKQTTSLVNGLYLADSFASVLQTEFNGLLWWDMRNGTPNNNGVIIGNQSASLYGWRNYGDYGVISTPLTGGSSSYYETYPTYYAIKLLSHFAAGGDQVVKVTGSSTDLAAYAVKRTDGTLSLLVINKNSVAANGGTFTLHGFTPAPHAPVYTYGIPQDNAAHTGTGLADVTYASATLSGTPFTMVFGPYSATVISLVPSTTTASKFVNLSTRASCRTGDNVTIGGFGTNGAKRVLLRAVGPTLGTQGLTQAEVLADPMIELHDALHGNGVIGSNDNWGDTAGSDITATGAQVGATPFASGDTTSSAALLNLNSGVYSFIGGGKNSTSGIVLVEVYDADALSAAPSLVNISSRAYCTTGNGVTIGGFVIAGNAPKHVLLRAVGPSLNGQGGLQSSQLLADPKIDVYSGSSVIATNDNWGDNADASLITATATAVGAQPLLSSDTTSSALLLTLPPGIYTFIASGKNGSSGIVLIELYDADAVTASTATMISNGDVNVVATPGGS